MPTTKADLAAEYHARLNELSFLLSNPLASLSDASVSGSSLLTTDVLRELRLDSEKTIQLEDLTHGKSADEVRAELAENVRSIVLAFHGQGGNAPTERRTKAAKTSVHDYPSRIVPDIHGQSKRTVSSNISSQIAALEVETNEFLNKRTAELDVILLPEHYPTQLHNVSSLAELYYMTQTLPLIKLIPGSHKTLMTENFELALLEGKIAVLFSRIEELKRQKKWSLRQPIRYYDPFIYSKRNKKGRDYTWDNVLNEGKWMAADFKESTKFKKYCCLLMAQGIQDYWTYGKVVCVQTKPINYITTTEDATTEDAMEVDQPESNGPIPETIIKPILEQTVESEMDNAEEIQEEPTIDVSKLLQRPDPAAEITPHDLPRFTPEDLQRADIDLNHRGPFKAHLNIHDMKRIDQSIIRNLPKFTAFDDDASGVQQSKPLKTGETSIVPVSRMLYPMDDDDYWHKIVLKDNKNSQSQSTGPPEFQKGLFDALAHRRFNFLRPPKPPLIKNIDYRSPTIWLPQDDKYLIHYVAEYCFNWDLIAENLLASSATLKRYESNIERRTPWQCFERYIQLNEKFQFSDMKGINAFLAQQWLEHAHKAQLTTKRRISPLGVGAESIQRGHRRLRWASMFDAMRKSMRKREIAAAKSTGRKPTNGSDYSSVSSNAQVNATGSANSTAKRGTDRIPNPSELSKLKYERDKSIQEAYVHQQATRSKMMAAVSQQKSVSGQSLNGGSAVSTDNPGSFGSNSSATAAPRAVSQISRPSGVTTANLQRPQAIQATSQIGGAAASQATVLQAQAKHALANLKRPTTPNGTPYTVEQIQRLLQLQKQRRMLQQQGQPSKIGTSATVPPQSVGSTGQKLAAAGQVPGNFSLSIGGAATMSPSSSTIAPGSSAKRPNPPGKSRIQFAPAQVSAIINSIQQKNPNLTKDQVTKLAASYLANLQQQQQNKLDQQMSRPGTDNAAGSLQSLQARQAQLNRQRLAAQMAPGQASKDVDPRTLAKLQYEERKKLMMQQGGSQYGQSGGATPPVAGLSPNMLSTLPNLSSKNSSDGAK